MLRPKVTSACSWVCYQIIKHIQNFQDMWTGGLKSMMNMNYKYHFLKTATLQIY